MRKEIILLTTLIGMLVGFLLPSGFGILGDVIANFNGSVQQINDIILLTPVIIFVEFFSALIFGIFGMLIGFIIEIVNEFPRTSSQYVY